MTLQITEVNDAPTANGDALSSIAEDSGDRTIPFASLIGNDSSGPANENGQSLTITNVSNPVGGTVEIVGTNVVFHPAADFNGTASFDYTVQDNGTTNGTADPLTDVGHASYSITPVQDSPVLDPDPIAVLLPAPLNSTNPIGTPIANLIVGVTDVDQGDELGIAITTIDNTKGKWQFNLDVDGTGTWQDVPTIPSGSAYLLADDGDTQVRFLPKRGFKGFSSVSFKVWDQFNGSPEGTLDNSVAGDESYSSAFERAWVAVGSTPGFKVDLEGNTVLTPVREDSANSATIPVAKLLGLAGMEQLPKKNLGIAITDAATAAGQWQYKLTKTKVWVNFGSVNDTSALLLKPTDQLRFIPNADADDRAIVTFKTWDGTNGYAGQHGKSNWNGVQPEQRFGVDRHHSGIGTRKGCGAELRHCW